VREYSPENIKGTIVALPKRTRVSQQGQNLSPYLNGIGACFLTINHGSKEDNRRKQARGDEANKKLPL